MDLPQKLLLTMRSQSVSSDPFSLFTYDIDFVAGTAKGGTQPYGNNTNDGRLFRDPTNVAACFAPAASGSLVALGSAGIRRTDRGAWHYPSATVRNLWSRDMTNAAWVKVNVTAAKDQTGMDGSANAASSLTATLASGTILQTITLASNTVLYAVFAKRLVGTGAVSMSVDGTTWADITSQLSASYALISISQAAVVNPVFGFQFAVSGDKIAVDFNQVTNPPVSGVNVPNQCVVATTSATILNSQSRPSADIADAAPQSLITTARGDFAFFWQGKMERANSGFIITGATNVFVTVQSAGAIQFSNGPGVSKTADGVQRVGLGQINKVAGYCRSGLIKVAANGVLGNLDTDATQEVALDHFDLCTNGAGSNSVHGLSERFCMARNVAFTDAELIALTAIPVTIPVNTMLPAISGTATQGQTLSCSTGTWIGGGSISYVYQWKADGINISAATASTYLLTATEVGKIVTCAVTATNSAGNATAITGGTSSVAPNDPFFANVKLLLGFEGTNGATTTTDESGSPHTMTFNGGAVIDTSQFKFGASSLKLNGSNAIVRTSDSADWNFSNGSFTVETFVRPAAVSGVQFLVGQWFSSGDLAWVLYLNGSTVAFNISTTGFDNNVVASGGTLATGAQYHVRFDFDGTKYRLYLEGTMVASSLTLLTINDTTNDLALGSNSSVAGGSFLNGWMDEVRITKGVARCGNDAGFTPPTAAFPRS